VRLAVSGLAWHPSEDEAVSALLRSHGIDAIDIAPGKYFPEPAGVDESRILALRDWWASRGIEITGMQALLYGTRGLNLFGPPEVRTDMLDRLVEVCRIGGILGATRLVFGSPRCRDRGNLADDEAVELAVSFFRRLGDIAEVHGVCMCLEPNPPRYGANFMTNSMETARVVAATGHPAIAMQLDTGAMTINGESPAEVIAAYASLIRHVHASEPGLVPLGDGGTDHGAVSAALSRHLPDRIVSVEMLATEGEDHLQSVARAMKIAIGSYRPEARRGTA
jgi:sugar phosphate isomerase/epimerase